MKPKLTYLLFFLLIAVLSCKKDQEVFSDNNIPPYSAVSTLQIQNYVNRLFIDILGREPLDDEMETEVFLLKKHNLKASVRIDLVEKLMFSTAPIQGDSSYNRAFYQKLYNDTKARLIEGVSDGVIQDELGIALNQAYSDSLAGDLSSYEQNKKRADKLQLILDCNSELRQGVISIQEVYHRMLDNSIYDEINMNTFNFVNASFNDLYYRYPTAAEFDNAYIIIENNEPSIIFGQVCANKNQYLEALTNALEFKEGLISWVYIGLLAREPSTQEVYQTIPVLNQSNSITDVQKMIFISGEYAQF